MSDTNTIFQAVLDSTRTAADRALKEFRAGLKPRETGTVGYVGKGIARVNGLPSAKSEELLRFTDNRLGTVFNLDPDEIGVILLDSSERIEVGSPVDRTGRIVDVPVGKHLIGRTVDPMGRPLDNKGPIDQKDRRPIERDAPEMMDREPVEVPLQTGLKVIDSLIPIGRGQRELIVGDRQTGKSAIALDTIINQKGKDVICVFCSIGRKSSDVAKIVADLKKYDAVNHTIIVVAGGEDPPGLQFIAPYAATTMAEYFMEEGKDALVIYDDLSQHAKAYRELSLLLRRPPGREAYPGDIFYIHSRLLERATHLNSDRGGGSMTALPIVETQAQNISAYIPTNLISITDGQIYLSPQHFRKGLLPAVDVGKSVSRVGGKTQLPAYREISGDLRLAYSQFEELESFSRFSTRLDEDTRKKLNRGRRVREAFKQPQYQPRPVPHQIAVLMAVTEGLFDDLDLDDIADAEAAIRAMVDEDFEDMSQNVLDGKKISEEDKKPLLDAMKEIIGNLDSNSEENQTGDKDRESDA